MAQCSASEYIDAAISTFTKAAMRTLSLIILLGLTACTGATLTKLDYRTYQLQTDAIPGGSDAPNRRLAEQVCPGGYRVLTQTASNNTPDRARDEPGVFTTWTIRCL
ncbi:MAG TPA: hypothetical protein VGR45_05555 [Stellaceae bacterium]|nr:hypothetical protein [Stellaceae bacterium]